MKGNPKGTTGNRPTNTRPTPGTGTGAIKHDAKHLPREFKYYLFLNYSEINF